jgi:uncharacterized protein YjbI with pentapeptide repeats
MADEKRVTTLHALLKREEFESLSIEDVDCAGADLSDKTFYDCDFRRISGAEVDLARCTFDDCRFERCDLTMANLMNAKVRSATFLDCKLMGIDWSNVTGVIFGVGFEGCVLSYGSFVGLKMANTKFVRCKAHETTFADLDLTGADFSDTELNGAKFLDTDLTSADLSTAIEYGINPNENRLNKTKFSPEAAIQLAETLGVIVE